MSLVNKMLRDLEARQTAPNAAKPVFQDLSPVRPAGGGRSTRLLVVLLIVVAIGVVFYLGADELIAWRSAPATRAVAPVETVSAPVAAVEASRPIEANVVPAAIPPAQPPADTAIIAPAPEPLAAKPPQPAPAPTPRTTSSPTAPTGRIVEAAKSPPVTPAATERKVVAVAAPKPKPERSAAVAVDANAGSVDKTPRPLTAEETAEVAYRAAIRLLDQGRSDDALRELRAALVSQPTHIKARELAAGIELQTGHWREAEKLLEEGLRQVPKHYLFARMLARVYVDRGAEAKALAVLESALPSGSDDADFSSLLALLYQRSGRHADAVKAYERAATLRPSDGRIWLGFAISLEGIEQWGPARDAYRRAMQNELPASLARYAEQRLAALQNQ